MKGRGGGVDPSGAPHALARSTVAPPRARDGKAPCLLFVWATSTFKLVSWGAVRPARCTESRSAHQICEGLLRTAANLLQCVLADCHGFIQLYCGVLQLGPWLDSCDSCELAPESHSWPAARPYPPWGVLARTRVWVGAGLRSLLSREAFGSDIHPHIQYSKTKL